MDVETRLSVSREGSVPTLAVEALERTEPQWLSGDREQGQMDGASNPGWSHVGCGSSGGVVDDDLRRRGESQRTVRASRGAYAEPGRHAQIDPRRWLDDAGNHVAPPSCVGQIAGGSEATGLATVVPRGGT